MRKNTAGGSRLILGISLLALWTTALPAVAADRAGVWEGITRQDRPLTMTIAHRRLQYLQIAIEFPECRALERVRARRQPLRIRDDGWFRLHLHGVVGRRDTLTIHGTFTARRRASGWFRADNYSTCRGERTHGTWEAVKSGPAQQPESTHRGPVPIGTSSRAATRFSRLR